MVFLDHPVWMFFILFALLEVVSEWGVWLRSRRRTALDGQYQEQVTAAAQSIAVLLSLLLGFTFPMAVQRYDLRKNLMVREANAIETAIRRSQTLPEPERTRAHELFVEYVDIRLGFFVHGISMSDTEAVFAHSRQVQYALWQQSLPVARSDPNNQVTALYLESLNAVREQSEENQAALENRIPGPIWFVLFFIALLTCVSLGFGLKGRTWFSVLLTPLTISLVMALIADLDSPRKGLIVVGRESMERVQHDLKLPY
jgi:hypothetical protein